MKFDWRRLFVGVKPHTLAEALKALRYWKIVYFVCLFAFIVIWFGTSQLNAELDVCWDELKDYRIGDQSLVVPVNVSGVVGDGCLVQDNLFVCPVV